jgi:hypothetical protein
MRYDNPTKQIVIYAHALILQYPHKIFQWIFGNFDTRALTTKYVNLTLFCRPTGREKLRRPDGRKIYRTVSSQQARKRRNSESILLYVKMV